MSGIIFEPYTGPADVPLNAVPRLDALRVVAAFDFLGTDGDAFVRMPLLKAGGDQGMEIAIDLAPFRVVAAFDALGAYGDAITRLPSITAYGIDTEVVPSVSIVYTRLPALQVDGSIKVTHVLAVDTAMPSLRMVVSEDDTLALACLPALVIYSYSVPEPVNYISAFGSPGALGIGAGAPVIEDMAEDVFVLQDIALDKVYWTFASNLMFAGVAGTTLTGGNTVSSNVAFNDAASGILYIIASSALVLADTPSVAFYGVLEAASQLQMLDSSLDAVAATLIASSMLVMVSEGALGQMLEDSASSAVVFTDTLAAQARAIASAASALVLIDSPSDMLVAVGVAADNVTFEDALNGILSGGLSLLDTLSFTGLLRITGDPYAVYSVSLGTQAVSEYTRYDYNSYCVVDDVAYGMGAEGIFELDGESDNGVNIDARFRVGLSQMGTASKKRVPAVYLGYSSSGALALRVISTASPNAEKRVNTYELRPVAKNAMTDGRVEPSKGLNSVYYQFELANVDGSTFEFDNARVWRMVTSRRK